MEDIGLNRPKAGFFRPILLGIHKTRIYNNPYKPTNQIRGSRPRILHTPNGVHSEHGEVTVRKVN